MGFIHCVREHVHSGKAVSHGSVDIEVRKRTMWAIYCLHISSSTTYGRPPMLSLADLGMYQI